MDRPGLDAHSTALEAVATVGHRGSCTWACDLRRDDHGVPGDVIATVLLEADDERDIFYATIDERVPGITDGQYREIGEFLIYAGQSKDIWIKVNPARECLVSALLALNYKVHQTTKDFIELTHDWPPDFWGTPAPFNHMADADGNLIPDWRSDVWGGRAVDE